MVDNYKLIIYYVDMTPDNLGRAEMSAAVKIRVVREYEAADLPAWLTEAASESGKSVAAICREAEITTQYWYDVLRDKKPIRLDTLEKLESALGRVYPTDWRDR